MISHYYHSFFLIDALVVGCMVEYSLVFLCLLTG
jgi:hypothetical protein